MSKQDQDTALRYMLAHLDNALRADEGVPLSRLQGILSQLLPLVCGPFSATTRSIWLVARRFASTMVNWCQPPFVKPDPRTVAPATKIGSSLDDLRNYKIPKIRRQQPPVEEHDRHISRASPVSQRSKKREEQEEHRKGLIRSQSRSPLGGRSSSRCVVNRTIEDMNKACPRVPSGYISCGDGCPLQNEAGNEFPRSPTMRPLEDDWGISGKVAKLATLGRMPLSSHVRQKQQTEKVCVMCKRRDISDAGGQDTWIRCSLCKQITKERAAVKEKGGKERLAAPEPDTPAKLHKHRASSDVENRERDAKTPTCPLSSRSDNRVKVDTVSPQGKKHRIVSKKQARKAYLTKPVISLSDESCSEDDGCSATATAVSVSQQVETLISSGSPALVAASIFSLTLADWEGLKNEWIDDAESMSVGGMTGKIAPTSTLVSSDSGPLGVCTWNIVAAAMSTQDGDTVLGFILAHFNAMRADEDVRLSRLQGILSQLPPSVGGWFGATGTIWMVARCFASTIANDSGDEAFLSDNDIAELLLDPKEFSARRKLSGIKGTFVPNSKNTGLVSGCEQNVVVRVVLGVAYCNGKKIESFGELLIHCTHQDAAENFLDAVEAECDISSRPPEPVRGGSMAVCTWNIVAAAMTTQDGDTVLGFILAHFNAMRADEDVRLSRLQGILSQLPPSVGGWFGATGTIWMVARCFASTIRAELAEANDSGDEAFLSDNDIAELLLDPKEFSARRKLSGIKGTFVPNSKNTGLVSGCEQNVVVRVVLGVAYCNGKKIESFGELLIHCTHQDEADNFLDAVEAECDM
ncbi:hypothetical protein HPB49_010603 [Dermacentor silvarum]|uniref:Uncharacterized protein n=1 Tax=Dermacentor silvarum TaxID=543639 RepID=A0ACB8E034_DERSI|nr:hypothetical protein HPB49_010603 [Dermacentor silvarum]